MEKYVIDLDKVLDELELCDNGKHGICSSDETLIIMSNKHNYNLQMKQLASTMGSTTPPPRHTHIIKVQQQIRHKTTTNSLHHQSSMHTIKLTSEMLIFQFKQNRLKS